MSINRNPTRIRKEDIKNSALNNLGLDTLENAYSSGEKNEKPKIKSYNLARLIATLSTLVVIVTTFGSVYGLYAFFFGSEERLSVIGLDDASILPFTGSSSNSESGDPVVSQPTDNNTITNSSTQNPSSNTSSSNNPNQPSENNNQNPSGINKFCSVGSIVPDQVCEAILSIKIDKTASNSFISLQTVNKIEQLPADADIVIIEESWESLTETSGRINTEVYASPWGDFLVQGEMEYIGNKWIVSDIFILEGL
jgi:hypothetical protein